MTKRIIFSNYRNVGKITMYCPLCATENELELGYCRQCGQALGDVRLALDGRSTEALERLRTGAKWMNGGMAALISFTVIAILIAISAVALGDPALTNIAMINLLLGALIGLPILFIGTTSVRRATRLLSRSQSQLGVREPGPLPGDLMTTGLNTNALRAIPESVTEHTTFDLQEPEQSVPIRRNIETNHS